MSNKKWMYRWFETSKAENIDTTIYFGKLALGCLTIGIVTLYIVWSILYTTFNWLF